ncbi:MAG: hypothetical protein VX498_01405 [Myxococcota bacterium]|nr:hypothetical protein [Myxococcota bacterium]
MTEVGPVLLLGLLLLGCGDNSGDFLRGELAGQDDDDLAGDDDDDDDDDDGEPGGPGVGPRGGFGIWYWEMPPGPSGGDYESVAGFIAEFVDEITSSVPGTGGVTIASPDTPDTCVATVWDADEQTIKGGTPGQVEPLHAGNLTLSSPTWTAVLEPSWGKGGFQYGLELNPDYEVHFETYYTLEATGGTFPAFLSDTSLLVPDPVHLVLPSPSEYYEVGPEDFEIEWTGGSQDELWLEFHNGGGLETDNVQINCRPLNDGSFVVPGTLTQLFAPGDEVVLLLSQPRSEVFEVGDYSLGVGSASSSQSSGLAW